MTVDLVTARSRRNLLLGGLAGLAAAAAATMSGAQRVLAAGSDGAVIHVGDDLEDARTQTTLGNFTNDTATLVVYNGQAGAGIDAASAHGSGVNGHTINGTGVSGAAVASSGFALGVFGVVHTPGGVGVLGNNTATTGNAQGVQGTSDSPKGFATTGWARHGGLGVVGASGSTFPSVPTHTGVYGFAHGGRGVVASGDKAQVRLVPSSASSHPHSGATGDLFLDKHVRLWLCRGGTSWHQLG